jgi:hypothetical protein
LFLSVALLVSQLRTVGTSAYYFLKFFMGFELVLAAFVPAVLGVLVALLPPGVIRRGSLRVLVAVLATALASQAFGRFPGSPAPLMETGRDGTASVARPLSAAHMARGILAAVDTSTSATSFSTDYLAIGPDRAKEAFYPDGWYHGILASLSARNRQRLDLLRSHVDEFDDAVRVARAVLSRNGDVVLIVSPAYAAPLRARLGAPLRDRVTTWTPGGLAETD